MAGRALEIELDECKAALTRVNARLREETQARALAEELLASERNALRAIIDHLPDRIAVKDTNGKFVLANKATLQHLRVPTPGQVGGNLDRAIGCAGPAVQLEADEQAILQSGQPLVNQEETHVDETGIRTWLLTTKIPMRNTQGQSIGLVSMSRDITLQKRTEQHLALRFAVTRIVSDSETRQVATQQLLEAICMGIGAGVGELWRVDASANLLRWEAAWYVQSLEAANFVAERQALTFPPRSDLPGLVWAIRQPLQLSHSNSDVSMHWQCLAADLGFHHSIAFPVSSGSTMLGVFLFWSQERHPYDAELLTILTDLGSQIGLFFERIRMEERLRQYVQRVVDAQEAERDHIARELHDEIGHALALIKMNVRGVHRLTHESDLAPRLEQSLAMIEETLQHVRTLALDLRPSMLDDLGLVTTLNWYVKRHAQWAGLVADITVENFETRIPQHLETVCFRVAQEALSNVARHAQAHMVHLKLWQQNGAVHMLIRDDGIGFDVLNVQERALDSTSIGLLGMEDRVTLAGGQLAIESAPSRGTTVWLRLPVDRRARAGGPATQGDV
jgi:signal transduction histidine kinase